MQRRCIAIAREQGNKEAEWRLLWDLGVAYEKYGKLEEELAAFTQAEDMTKEFGYAFENIPEPSLIGLRCGTEIGIDIWRCRQRIVASGVRLLTREEVAQELNERRGSRNLFFSTPTFLVDIVIVKTRLALT
ncbi:MAG: hypothetical protein GDA56_14180 [Hormoscilla sp. GM7CHS1pb]|nr:hypothetical protein [Hormoscilla sp. GM7CHS1pb]